MAIAEYITKVELDALEKRLLKAISDVKQRVLDVEQRVLVRQSGTSRSGY